MSGVKSRNSLMNGLGWFFTVLVYFISLLFLSPFIVLFITTFKTEKYVFDPFYVPDFTYLENYRMVFETSGFFRSMGITAFICACSLGIAILISSMAGYMVIRGREWIYRATYFVFVVTLIIPGQANMVMNYKLGAWLHLINTIPFLILLYVAGNVAYSSMIYSAFVKTIPIALEEAACIDGCGRFNTFFSIVFPLLKPATGTVVAIEIFWYWNDFQGPLIYLNGDTSTLMMEIFKFKSIAATNLAAASVQWAPVSAICFLATVPILIFFIFTQKYLIKGLTVGAVKG